LTKFLADENIPLKAVETLRQKDIDITTTLKISPGLSDKEVLNLANKQGRIIITFDTDFGKLAFKEKLKVKGIILLRFIPKSPQHIAKRIENLPASGTPIENCFLLVKEDSVRVIPMK
jgi:predicted nuclease of predicted toxin-antitoxin system